MNIELKKKLQSLELSDLVQAIEEQEGNVIYADKSFDERIELLAEKIGEVRYNKLVKKLITNATFKYPSASIESLDFESRKEIKNTIINLSNMKFIESNTNLNIVGPTGSGKTYLACAFGVEACKKTYRVYYIRMQNLTRRIDELTGNPKELKKFLKKLSNYSLLIIDEWLTYKVSDKELKFIYELFELRSDYTSTIFVTQYNVSEWHERLLGGQHADSIMDRIVHNSFDIPSVNDNIRKKIGETKVKELTKNIDK